MRLIVFAFFLILTFYSQPVFAQQGQGENSAAVKIQLRWNHQFQFAGYYAAIEKGFYAEEGLQVELVEFDPDIGRIEPVLSGKALYGVSDSTLLRERLAGAPVVLLAQIFQHSPLVLLTSETSEIYSPFEMANKRIMYNQEDLPIRAIFETFQSVKINYQRIPHSHDPMDLVEGRVDAISAYLTDQPYFFQKLGFHVNIIDPRSYGYDFYGDNLFTTEKEISDHPDRVEKVLKATLRGWKYALEHQDEIIDLILTKYNPRLDRDQLAYEAKMTARMVLPNVIPLGTINKGRYEAIQQTLFEMDELKGQLIFPEAFIYTPQAADRARLTAEDKEWLKQNPDVYFVFAENNEPVLFKNSSGEIEGLLAQFLSLLNDRLGTSFKIKLVQSEEFKPFFDEKKANGVLAATPHAIQFWGLKASDKFTQITPVVYAREDVATGILSINDLAGKTVAHYRHSHLLDKVLKPTLTDSKIIIAKSPVEALELVFEGKADAMIGLSYHSLLLKKYYFPNIVPALTLTDQSLPVVMGLRPDQSELLAIVNKGLAAIGEEAIDNLFKQIAQEVQPSKELKLSEQEHEWLKFNPAIKVGIDNDFKPIEFRDQDGVPQGISIDYLRRLEEILGIRMLVVPNPDWLSTLEALKDGTLDMGMALGSNDEREKYLSFLPAHLSLPTSIFAQDNAGYIGDLSELSNKKVALVEGYPFANQLQSDYPQIEIVPVKNIKQGLSLLAARDVDAFIDATIVTSNYISELGYSSIKIVGDTPYSYHLAVAVNKDLPTLQSLLAKAMNQISLEEREKIHRNWFTVKYEHGFDYTLIWKIGGPILLLIILFAYWAWLLNQEVAKRKKAEERFRGILEGVKEDYFFFSYDLDGILHYVSSGAQNVLGIPAEELIGKSWGVLNYSDKTFAAAKERNRKLLSGEIDEGLMEIEYTHPDGEQRILTSQAHVVYDEPGKPSGFEGIIKNVTQERVAAKKLLEAKEQAEIANRAKSAFLANMSHELRTPLTAIIGYAHLLKKQKDLPAKALQKAETIDRSGQHLVQMINDVLEVSKIEAGQLDLKPEVFDSHKLLDEIEEMFKLQAQQKGVDLLLTNNLPEMRLETDIGKLRQILINLIGNACKFTDSGSIRVACEYQQLEEKQALLEIKVKDTGPGLSEEEQGKLFQPFEQGEAGRQKGGTGLGLVISKKYAKLLKGDLTVSSQKGRGSCFTLTCQAKVIQIDHPAPTRPEELEIDYSKLNGLKFLVADDDHDIRGFIVGLLQPYGIEVLEAEDGEQAISIALEAKPDMIVMDIRMPGVDGHQAIERLKSSSAKDIPIMIATASVLGDERTKAENSKADFFMTKPVDVDEFFNCIASALNIPRIEEKTVDQAAAQAKTDIADLPEKLRSQLKTALETLEPSKINLVIDEIVSQYPEIGRTIKPLAEDFRYAELSELL